MVAAFTLSNISESYFLVGRPLDSAVPFNLEDKQKILDLLLRFPGMHYWMFLERGLVPPATRPFSPREQSVIHLRLGALTEKEIAEKLELSKGTIHNYITEIYTVLNVKSRYEMNQLWLKQISTE